MITRRPFDRLRDALRGESGIGLIEVIVALMVFSVIAVGMVYSMYSIQKLTGESMAREAAANLASAEMDRIQSQPDPFKVFSQTTTPTVNGIPYTVKTKVAWVSTTGATGTCGQGGGNLQYKRVNIEVTWPGQYLDNPVRVDSILAPDTRINDPAYGTILVVVTGEDGTGRSSVTVTVTKVVDGATITGTIDPTDSDGCTYILKVVPGTYKVQVSKTNYRSKVDQQSSTPFKEDLQVVAGATATAAFTYDDSSTFTLDYAANGSDDVTKPNNLDLTYVGGLSDVTDTSPGNSVSLYPMPAGYQAIAGLYATCANTDPMNWTPSTGYLGGIRADEVGTAPGGSAIMPVPMGVVKVKVPDSNSRRYITAVQQGTSGSGNPGCADTTSYTFPRFTRDSTQYIALPYGTWKIYAGNSSGSTSELLTDSRLEVEAAVIQPDGSGGLVQDALGNSGVNSSTSVVTLDPRQPE
ncbi:MAG: hypothetical protein KF727_11115 [Microbacteriaceae bacterium]|nr:hypothetical protein [Microbacteriaceae bacterium]